MPVQDNTEPQKQTNKERLKEIRRPSTGDHEQAG